MDKYTFLINVVKEGLYRKLSWMISAFALVHEDQDTYKSDPYPYRLIQTPTGFSFIDPDNNNELTTIVNTDGTPISSKEPLFRFKDKVTIKANTLPLIKADIETTIGILLANFILLYTPFKEKFNYINGPMSISKIETEIAKNLDKLITVEEYKLFADCAFYLTGFTQLCVYGNTRKTIVPPPGIYELRKKLLLENKDRLHDPTVVAKIEGDLISYYKDYLSDDPSKGSVSMKSAKKLFLMMGAEAGFEESPTVKVIEKSLSEGWDVKALPDMINTMRIGAFKRGAETELGGVQVKWLLRASSNMRVSGDYCGTKVGKRVLISNDNLNDLIGFSILTTGDPINVHTKEEAMKYIGKEVLIASPMYCKSKLTDYCKTCVGEKLSIKPNALSMAVAAKGSVFMLASLKAMHGVQLSVADLDLKTAFT